MDAIGSTTATASNSAFVSAIRKKAVELEGVFLNTLVSQMMSGLDANNGFGGGEGEQTWRSMQSELLANQIAESGGIGLADDIMRSLLARQEVQPLLMTNP